MEQVYDNEDMIGMEKKKYRRKGSGQINANDVEFDFRATETSNFRRHS